MNDREERERRETFCRRLQLAASACEIAAGRAAYGHGVGTNTADDAVHLARLIFERCGLEVPE